MVRRTDARRDGPDRAHEAPPPCRAPNSIRNLYFLIVPGPCSSFQISRVKTGIVIGICLATASNGFPRPSHYFPLFFSTVSAHTINPKKVPGQNAIISENALGPCSYSKKHGNYLFLHSVSTENKYCEGSDTKHERPRSSNYLKNKALGASMYMGICILLDLLAVRQTLRIQWFGRQIAC